MSKNGIKRMIMKLKKSEDLGVTSGKRRKLVANETKLSPLVWLKSTSVLVMRQKVNNECHEN